MSDHFITAFNEAKKTLENFFENNKNVFLLNEARDCLVTAITANRRIYSCGNGGSMCDSMHFAEELTGRFRKERKSIAAVSISDPAHLSCVANDYGYDYVFSRFVEAWGDGGDVLLAISTSGNSQNVINASLVAKKNGMKIIGLLGKSGGVLKDIVDYPLIVESETSDRIQEIHIKIIHMFIEGIERKLFSSNY